MERLTEKSKYGYREKDGDYKFATQKLGKLEDIEDELGISLEVLFKALKEGIYIVEKNKKEEVKIEYDIYYKRWVVSDYDENIINLEKYGEEWY